VENVIAQACLGSWRFVDGLHRYSINALGLNNGGRIIEVGGYVGEYVEQLSRRYPKSKIEVYEPLPRYFRAIKERFKDNPLIISHCAGVGVASSKIHIVDAAEGSYTVKGGTIPVVDVVSVVGKGCELLNLNCEGDEYAILRRLIDTGAVRKVRVFQIDWHWTSDDWKEKRRRLRTELSKTHKMTWRWPYVRELWTRC